MGKNKFIEVQGWGDFDILYTVCVMYNENNDLTANQLSNDFCLFEGVKDPTLINDGILSEVTEDFIAYLELKGFTKIETDSIYFCH